MANKMQISSSLAFLAAAIILMAGKATARRELQEAKVDEAANPTLEMVLNEMITGTHLAKAKVYVLGNSQMVHDCDKAYALSLENLNKAMSLVKGSGKETGDIKAIVLEALHAYEMCDYSFAKSTRPSPFIPNNADLKSLGSKCLELASKQANNN